VADTFDLAELARVDRELAGLVDKVADVTKRHAALDDTLRAVKKRAREEVERFGVQYLIAHPNRTVANLRLVQHHRTVSAPRTPASLSLLETLLK
jgi:hypothetical protein